MQKGLLVIAVGTIVVSQAWAGVVVAPTPPCTTATCVSPTVSGSRTDNKLLVGINWSFGAKVVPELLVGFRSIKTKESGRASGAGIDLTFPFGNGIAFDKVRLIGLDGRNDALGQLGFGYSALAKGFLFNIGAEVPYAMAGVDYIGGAGWVPYAGLHTQGRYKKPDSLGCGSGYTLQDAGNTTLFPAGVDAAAVVNGKTCFAPPPVVAG